MVYILGGDLNKDNLDDVIFGLPSFTQVVDKPTRKNKTLDKLITNLEPVSCNILPPRHNDEDDVGSDHDIALCGLLLPIRVAAGWKKIIKRKYTKEGAARFKEKMECTDWEFLKEHGTATRKVNVFDNYMKSLYDECFPLTITKVKEDEPLFFNENLRKLSRKVQRLSCGKGPKRRKRYKAVQKIFKKKYREASKSYFNDILDDAIKNDQQRWHGEIRKLMANGGRRAGRLQAAPEIAKMSDREKATYVAREMESLTSHYNKLDKDRMHACFAGGEPLPLLSVDDVQEAIKKMKVPKGLHETDPPRKVLMEMGFLYATPLQEIFNTCIQNGDWPDSWKQEMVTLIPKKPNIKSTNDYRPIALTNFWSKTLESLIRDVILLDVGDQIDMRQFGGLKGTSCEHHLSHLYDSITYNRVKGYSTVLTSYDFKKAFNTLSHDSFLISASKLGVRPAVLRILAGYLENRTFIVKWEEEKSPELPSRGGSGQGTLLSVLIFVIKMNDLIISLDSRIFDLEGPQDDERPVSQIFVYIDDVILTTPFLPSTMEDMYGDRIFVDNGLISEYLMVIEDFSMNSGLQLNQSKTFATTFDYGFRRTHFPQGSLRFSDGKAIEFVKTIKVLGVKIDQNLTFDSFVKDKRQKGHFNLWNLKRLQASSLSIKHMKMAFESYVKSKLEYGLVSAYPLLTTTQLNSLETVQRRASRTLLSISKRYGDGVPTYKLRLIQLDMLKLSEKLQLRFNEFATKAEFDKRFCGRFILKENVYPSYRVVRDPCPYIEEDTNRDYRRNSPIAAACTIFPAVI